VALADWPSMRDFGAGLFAKWQILKIYEDLEKEEQADCAKFLNGCLSTIPSRIAEENATRIRRRI